MPNFIPTSATDGTLISDDFVGNSAVADATLGTVGWELATIANASTLTFVAGQNGILRIATNGTAQGDGVAITTHPDGLLLAGTNQEFQFRVRYPTLSGNILATNNFRIGFGDILTATDHAVGVWVNSLAGVIDLDGASTNGDINVAAAGVSTLTSGTTMVIDTWHDFKVIMDGTNTNGGPDRIRLWVDGELAATISNFLLGSTETMEFGIVHWQTASGGDTLELDVDYIEAWLPRN